MTQSAVQFATHSRIHIAIAVSDLEASLAFYRPLFGQEPTKIRPGYAKFEVADPPVNFTLNETPTASAPPMPQHFGVQVKSTQAVGAAKARVEGAGVGIDNVEEGVTCCYAVQDKFWATDPDGHRWEVFVVLDADAAVHSIPSKPQADEEPCCAPSCCK